MKLRLRALAVSVLLVPPALFLAGCNGAPGQDRGRDHAVTNAAGEALDNATSVTASVREPDAAAAKTPGPAQPADANRVNIDNFAFNPRTLTVAAGTKVTWVNHDDVPHTATSTARPRAFDSRTLDTDARFAHIFTTPGTYAYFCAVHPHMTGTIIVK
jgi:plastocyanin